MSLSPHMRTVLICHQGALLDEIGLARWLASFSDLAGVVLLRETKRSGGRRIRREIRRVGLVRFIDVLAFRLYYALFLARRDRKWQECQLEALCRTYPPPGDIPVLLTATPNSPEAEQFMRDCHPDMVLARCKTLLKERVFSIPRQGTFVLHPGVCPEYRNAHGCFWAIVNRDWNRVGMTLLRIDTGVDTGPVYGYYSYPYDASAESPLLIQHRVVLENLSQIEEKLKEIHQRRATPLDTSGRHSATWGQPWLSRYLKMRWTRNPLRQR
jgi:hypothetical protein